MSFNASISKKAARQASSGQKPIFELKVSGPAREAWQKVLREIHRAKDRLDVRGNEDWWYRGQCKSHSLRPSLFRLLEKDFNKRDGDARSIYELEYDLYFEFACRGPGMQEPGLSGWDKLVHMRHHGLPTRLLDWSERLGVAVFFALKCETTPKDPPVIWILSPCKLNKRVIKDRDLYSPEYLGYDWRKDERWDYEDYLVFEGGTFDWDGPVAIYPAQKNQRMRSQMGWFTIFGEDTRALEKQVPPKRNGRMLQKVEIPHVAIPAAREFLIEAGINEATVFPDLDGFSNHLKTYYGIPS